MLLKSLWKVWRIGVCRNMRESSHDSWDYKMGHANLVDKVGRTEIGVSTVAMVYE
jgi:hypothetical protein